MNDVPETNEHGEPDLESLEQDGVELSLDELGRAYAKAVGLVPDEPVETKEEAETRDDNVACELSPRSILEALLFVGSPDESTPLTSNQISSWIRGVTVKAVNSLAKELQAEYEQSDAAFRLHREQNRLRLVLAEEYALVRESFYGEIKKARLSQQAVDVLAIVAYNQPVGKELVNEMRSRECGTILNQLVKRQLLMVEPAAENPRTKLYRTSDRFLELFGLETIEDLPQSEDSSLPE